MRFAELHEIFKHSFRAFIYPFAKKKVDSCSLRKSEIIKDILIQNPLKKIFINRFLFVKLYD